MATTLLNILEHPIIQDLMDRQQDITSLIEDTNSFWIHDLFNRRPSAAEYDDQGKLLTTDLDLATFLYALSDREAVINLPIYKSLRPKSVQEGIVVTSSQNRHGQIMGLVSNSKVFSFGVRIKDMNVISTNTVGFPRCYLFTDFCGNWYQGWQQIDFIPTAKENKFLFENKLLTENKIIFKNFVTPQKWVSFYGQYYFITKALIERLVEEQTHLKKEKKKIIDSGIRIDDKFIYSEFPPTSKEAGTKIQVDAFEVEVDLPQFINLYELYPNTIDGLKHVVDKLSRIRKALENFRFVTRQIEFAASKQKYIETFPAWIKNVSWEKDYKTGPRSRTLWNRLKIVQPGPFQKSIALRTRWFKVTQEIADDAEVSENATNAMNVLG